LNLKEQNGQFKGDEIVRRGSPPRRRFGFVLILAVFVVLLVTAITMLFRQNPTDRQAGTSQAKIQPLEGKGNAEPDAVATNPSGSPSPEATEGEPVAVPAGQDGIAQTPAAPETGPQVAEKTEPATPESAAPAEPGTPEPVPPAESAPAVEVPVGADASVLQQLQLTPLPYSIYIGAYKTVDEAQTTQRELLSDYLPSYIVPVEVRGEVAQSLFGVTQDGSWFSVLVGHFTSKDEARKTLGRMMKGGTEGQPEIMQFPYALECGRYLDNAEAARSAEALSTAGFFPYTQTYQVQDGRTLTRVLLGCHFSEKGAADQKILMDKKEISACRAELR
jgi:cell division protein FtsN